MEHRISTSLAVARLRKLNRYSHLGCANAKEQTQEVGIVFQHHKKLCVMYSLGFHRNEFVIFRKGTRVINIT